MKAVVLAGGLGTRLRPVVADRPKPLAEINGEPFLQLQLRRLRTLGIQRAVLCVGHGADAIVDAIGDGQALRLDVSYSREEQPLGTAGALKHAEPLLAGERELLLLNGDTFVDVDPGALTAYHRARGGIGTLCLRQLDDVSGKGLVEIDADGRVTAFDEKAGGEEPGLINAGVYLLSSEILRKIPGGRSCSLEREVLPGLLAAGARLNGYRVSGTFIDIGTPADYARAQSELLPYGAAAWEPGR